MMKKFYRAFQISLLAILSFCVFSCAKMANEKLELVAPEGPEEPEPPAPGSNSENLDEIGELRLATNIDSYGTYYRFGIFPQRALWECQKNGRGIEINESVRWSDIHPESTLTGGENYFLGSDNCWYERMIKTEYNSNDNRYYTYKEYFRIEPIVWEVVCELPDEMLVLRSQNALTAMEFYKLEDELNAYADRYIDSSIVYPNNYEYSKIRAYLNSYDGRYYEVDDFSYKGFLTKAFNVSNREKLYNIEIDNSIDTTTAYIYWDKVWDDKLTGYVDAEIKENQYICRNTFDKIFVPSYSELKTFNFNGFSVLATSYTRFIECGGFWTGENTDQFYANYYTRSPCEWSSTEIYRACAIGDWSDNNKENFFRGYEMSSSSSSYRWNGLVPCIVIQKP